MGVGALALLLTGVILFILIFCTTSCVSPGAAKLEARVGVVEDNFNQLESVVDNNIENVDTLKEQLIEVSNTVNNSGIIKYSGAGWVVVGTGLMAIIFLLAIGIFLKYYFKAKNSTNMLKLVTTAVKNVSPEIGDMVKAQITKETSNGGKFNVQHKNQLSEFVKNN